MELLIESRNKATIVKEQFGVGGMSCASCAITLEKRLNEQQGIDEAHVSFTTNTVSIAYNPDLIRPPHFQDIAKHLGYQVIVKSNEAHFGNSDENERLRLLHLKKNLAISAVFSIPVFIISMFIEGVIPYENWIMMLLTLPVFIWGGQEIFMNAWKQLKHFSANMDTLVTLSTGITFIFSAFNTVFPQYLSSKGLDPHVYYESAAVIITLILLGRYLEEKAKSKTSSAIKKLMGLQPKHVKIFREGLEKSVAIEDVLIGDIVVVQPGAKIPIDGEVVEGESFVDESMISGEPLPVRKTKGDLVYCGTLNQNGILRIVARKGSDDTLLAQIIRMVLDAQSSKPPIQKLVDKIAEIFVPTVILVSFLAFIGWYILGPEPSLTHSIIVSITVLIIACPCALGLATPTALMVGIGNGAQQGILIKDAESLETLHKTQVLVLDKTGTITKGAPKVTNVIWLFYKSKKFQEILLAIESQSEHPIAKAICNKLLAENVKMAKTNNFENLPGYGVRAKFQDMWFWVGTEALMEEHSIRIDQHMSDQAKKLNSRAISTVFFADPYEVIGVIGIADEIKENSAKAVLDIKAMGIEVHMLTGDSDKTAAAIAKEAFIDNYRSSVLPADKGKYIKNLQLEGKVVAMAGDGINDSNALAQADIGIAMASGTDIAMDSSGITLMRSDLGQIAKAIRLSKATTKTIHQNLFWAFIYNIIAIPVAAGILYPAFGFLLNPMIAGAAMAFSSISVVTNSLRLRKVNISN